MSLEILSIGNELLTGYTENTNVGTIARRLLKEGFGVDRVTYLPDEPARLKEGILEALNRSSFIITTGGLGPTGDDLTADILADIYQTPLDQVTQIPNPLGTAAGLIFEGKGSLLALPGVPAQMEVMLDAVCAYLSHQEIEKGYVQPLYICCLREQEVDSYLRILEKEHPEVTIGICPSYGTLSVYLHAKDRKAFPPVAKKIAEKFKTHLYSTADRRIEVALQEWMVSHHKTLAVGESCTGGRLSQTLTALPGASDYFLGGIVAYSNHLKEKALAVSPQTLKSQGAVSQEAVLEMADGVKKLTHADYVITTSGIAGPSGGTSDKPVGTVWAAILTPEKTFTGLIPCKYAVGKRELVIDTTVTYLLSSFLRFVTHHIEPFA